MLASELRSSGEWAGLSALTHLALDRPARAAACLAASRGGAEEERRRAALVLRRQGPAAVPSPMKLLGERWPGFVREGMKEMKALLPSPDGTLWWLGTERLVQVDRAGKTLQNVPLAGAKDLTRDQAGAPLAVGFGRAYWGGKIVALSGISSAASAAETPDGRIIVLDDRERVLYRVSLDGKIEGKRSLTLRAPSKVRSDASGRIYILDRGEDKAFVYSAALVPLREIDPEKAGHPMRRVEEMAVDFAGDILLSDNKREAALFSAQGRYLGSLSGEDLRLDAVGWDGFGLLLFASRRDGFVGRASS